MSTNTFDAELDDVLGELCTNFTKKKKKNQQMYQFKWNFAQLIYPILSIISEYSIKIDFEITEIVVNSKRVLFSISFCKFSTTDL